MEIWWFVWDHRANKYGAWAQTQNWLQTPFSYPFFQIIRIKKLYNKLSIIFLLSKCSLWLLFANKPTIYSSWILETEYQGNLLPWWIQRVVQMDVVYSNSGPGIWAIESDNQILLWINKASVIFKWEMGSNYSAKLKLPGN